MSQSRALWDLVANSATVAPAVTIAAVVLATAMALRYLRPRWPATTIALAIGLALGLLWLAAGHPTPTIGAFGWTSVLPVSLADFGSLRPPGVLGLVMAAPTILNMGDADPLDHPLGK